MRKIMYECHSEEEAYGFCTPTDDAWEGVFRFSVLFDEGIYLHGCDLNKMYEHDGKHRLSSGLVSSAHVRHETAESVPISFPELESGKQIVRTARNITPVI